MSPKATPNTPTSMGSSRSDMDIDVTERTVEEGDQFYLELWGLKGEDGHRPRFTALFEVALLSDRKVRIESGLDGYRGSYEIPRSLFHDWVPRGEVKNVSIGITVD